MKCYICNHEIVSENVSIEHIIPNSIGGKLKSTKLLCNACNKNLGHEIDNELFKTFHYICTLLNIKREKGSTPPITLETETNVKYKIYANSDIEIVKPKINISEIDNKKLYFNIVAPMNRKIINQILTGLKRKYPELNKEELLENSKAIYEIPKERLKMSFNFYNKECLRAIAKIACNFYLLKDGNVDNLNRIIKFIQGTSNNNFIWTFYRQKNIITDIKHTLCLIGNNEEKLLFCYT